MRTLILLAFLGAAALAQQKVIAAGSSVPASCAQQINIAADKIKEVGNPDKSWTWGVVCSERDWSLITRTAQIDHNTDCAVSLLGKAFTYLRGKCLSDPEPTVTPGFLIAHEIGHIQTGSTKEKDADKWAKDHGYEWGHKDRPIQAPLPETAALSGQQ